MSIRERKKDSDETYWIVLTGKKMCAASAARKDDVRKAAGHAWWPPGRW
jgi:hypothetical protein